MLNGKRICITGGTGSFGQAFLQTVLRRYPAVKEIVLFGRDEQKHFETMRRYPPARYPVRYLIGDVRDKRRLVEALRGCDIVVHAAAMKHVHLAEMQPMEAIKSNILGTQNLIEAAIENGVGQVVGLSTDKAADAVNVYGATKFLTERLLVSAHETYGGEGWRFNVVRYGNIFGSRGSVVPIFEQSKASGVLPITDPEMTRFSMTLAQSAALVLFALSRPKGGEIVVPLLPSYKVADLARAVCPSCRHDIVGMRPGEKKHEILIGEEESLRTTKVGEYYVVAPESEGTRSEHESERWQYDSYTNPRRLDEEELRRLLLQESGIA